MFFSFIFTQILRRENLLCEPLDLTDIVGNEVCVVRCVQLRLIRVEPPRSDDITTQILKVIKLLKIHQICCIMQIHLYINIITTAII